LHAKPSFDDMTASKRLCIPDGFTHSGFYNHFKSKQALAQAVGAAALEQADA
jgi:hypothetical protein